MAPAQGRLMRSLVASGRASEGSGAASAGERVVIVVEDDPVTAAMLEDLLRELGYAVEVLRSAIGVHGAIKRLRPCALLLDLGLPYRSGVTVLEELRANPATAHLPVLVVSALTELLSPDRAALATAVLPKPFDYDALVATLATVSSSAACRIRAEPRCERIYRRSENLLEN